jgi:excisionase family DNA binding protein
MLMTQACEYLGVTYGFLLPHMKSGLLNYVKDGRRVVFRKADLDAFKELPQYMRRVRRGRGYKKQPKVVQQLTPQAVKLAKPETLLTERAAADHLGIHYGVLALSRKYGTGPIAAVDSAGVPRYRLCDLDEFKARHLSKFGDDRTRSEAVKTIKVDGTVVPLPGKVVVKKDAPATGNAVDRALDKAQAHAERFALKPGEDASALVTMEDAALRLGVKEKTIANWRFRGVFGPEVVGKIKGRDRQQNAYRLGDVLDWATANTDSIDKARRMIADGKMAGHAPTYRPNGKKTSLKVTRKAPAKAARKPAGRPPRTQVTRATLGGGRVRH